VAEKITLGLLAGWDVETTIKNGYFVAASANTRPLDLVDSALAHPHGRRTLLNPNVQIVSIGTVVSENGGASGALFSAYEAADMTNTGAETAQVVTHLAMARQARGTAMPVELRELNPVLGKAAQRVQAGEEPKAAMQWLLDRSAEMLAGRQVRTWLVSGSSADELQFPQQMVDESSSGMAVLAFRHKMAGEPWARLFAFVISISEVSGQAI
jgi:hypothetical protein